MLNLPLDVQAAEVAGAGGPRPAGTAGARCPRSTRRASAGSSTRWPRRGGPSSSPAGAPRRRLPGALERLAERAGALLATSAVANGLFEGNPWSLGISGGFATPLAGELLRGADLVVGWGCALNMWTTSHGALIGPEAPLVQVDVEPDALGRNRPISLGVVGDVRATATAAAASLPARTDAGYRSPDVADRIARRGRWRDVAIEDTSTSERIDPRVLSIALDDLLPRERVVAIDSGNFMGYPSAYLAVPDEFGYCMTQAFQSIGLGLATAIGAALAQPDRLAVAALGDGGALMSASELETVVRLGLPMVVVVYNDAAYGAEVHHFGPQDTTSAPSCSRTPTSRRWRAASGSRRSPCAPWPTSTWSVTGSPDAAGHAVPRRRQGRRRPPVLVARGSLPRPLSGGRGGVRRRRAPPSTRRGRRRRTRRGCAWPRRRDRG